MKMKLWAFDLPLAHEFTISRGSMTVQPTLIVELEHEGYHGYGEATENSYYGHTLESMSQHLHAIGNLLQAESVEDPVGCWQRLDPHIGDDRFAQCALDQAFYDLWGKLQGKPIFQLWGLDATPEKIPNSNYTIGIDDIDSMISKMAEYPGWPIYKIKLGTDNDLDIVKELRKQTDAIFRVDANCGWTAEQTIEFAPQLKACGVEFIEQPLQAEDDAGMNQLRGRSVLPLIADENSQQEIDVARCHELGFDGINIKLVKCGGLTPARRMIEEARKLKMQVMVGCMTESSVGISAIAQLLPLLDYVDMDGAVLLSQDIATGVVLDRGRCQFVSGGAGFGVELIASGREL